MDKKDCVVGRRVLFTSEKDRRIREGVIREVSPKGHVRIDAGGLAGGREWNPMGEVTLLEDLAPHDRSVKLPPPAETAEDGNPKPAPGRRPKPPEDPKAEPPTKAETEQKPEGSAV